MIDAALVAIAEPHRREILRLVQQREMSAGEIAGHFDLTWSAVSQHLRVLVEAGLLEVRRDKQRRLYRPKPETMDALRRSLDNLWNVQLQALAEAAEEEERNKQRGNGRE